MSPLELQRVGFAELMSGPQVWYGEMKIPFDKLGVGSPANNTKLRAGIYRCAGREPGRKLISWQITGARSFHVPERFETPVFSIGVTGSSASQRKIPQK
jgi:hypothetical protein